MASTFKTPGVYIQEVSKFPPSVAQVETAIPAFIGYTAKAKEKADADLHYKPKRITSLLEYEQYFGGLADNQPEENLTVRIEETLDAENKTLDIKTFASAGATSGHVMYYAMQFYFANGGGPCYIVSAGAFGAFGTPIALGDTNSGLVRALNALEAEDEPTLIVFPESQGLSDADAGALHDAALAQCAKLQDRFTIMSVQAHTAASNPLTVAATFRSTLVGTDNLNYGSAYAPNLETIFNYHYLPTGITVTHVKTGGTAPGSTNTTLDALPSALQARVKAALDQLPCILPPAPAMAGIFAAVDSSRGVWKSPANVSLKSVVKPVINITHEQQESLNVDVTAGKSINAIRTFTGKGTLVWGARTLAGNDNEWRYISVRRFFIMVEESVKKASYQFVFEPNDANTWVKVRAMIENFLFLQWRAGALAGAKPEQAFYVKVGLGETMTALDILEGRMNVEIGMAVVRPAEFIILQFSHMMQQS